MKFPPSPTRRKEKANPLGWARRFYLRIGFHTAEESSFLYKVHVAAAYLYQALAPLLRRVPYRKSPKPVQILPEFDQKPTKLIVSFRVSGGVGDHLIAARYLRDLLATCGDFSFDVYSPRPQAAAWIFACFPQFNRCFDDFYASAGTISRYPLALWLMTFVEVHSAWADWLHVTRRNPKLALICKQIERFKPDIKFFVANQPRMDGYLAQVTQLLGMTRHNFLQGMSGIDYGGDLLPLHSDVTAVKRFGLEGRIYITIHNGFDDGESARVGVGRSSTKCYPRYTELLALLRKRIPSIYIVQLGTSTSVPITGTSLNLIGQTSLAETAEIIRRSSLHIDNEGGLVHLAACLGTTSCVIFGPTPADYFGYESNINIRPTFCGNCFWMTERWLVSCPRGFEGPRCLSLQDPAAIASALYDRLAAIFSDESAHRSTLPADEGLCHESPI